MKDVESASSVDSKPAVHGREGEVELRELRDLPSVGAMLNADEDGRNRRREEANLEEVDVTDRDASSRNERRDSPSPPPLYNSPGVEPTPRPRRPPARGSVAEASTSSTADNGDLVPDAIGRETCPICIVDFEEGDDLRVLPCEGHHRFHQQCVDPWLLELSSSCPLCRQGELCPLDFLFSQCSFDQTTD